MLLSTHLKVKLGPAKDQSYGELCREVFIKSCVFCLLRMGVDPVLDSDLDSEGENEDNSESSPADQDSPGSSVETSLQDRAAADESSPTVEQQPEEHFTTDTIKDIPQPTISHESDTTPQPVISHESDGTPQTEASADGNAQADIVYEVQYTMCSTQ